MAITPYSYSMNPMLADVGAELTDPVTQAGYTVNYDGYGLITLSAKFVVDWDEDRNFSANWKRGDACPIQRYKQLTLIRVSTTAQEGRTILITAEYVGVVDGMPRTDWQCTLASAAASEAIESHPNFSRKVLSGIGDVLAGPAKSDPEQTKNLAFFVNSAQAKGALPAWQFVGFLPQNDINKPINIKAGVKSYFKPNLTLKCMGYTPSAALAQQIALANGFVFEGGLSELSIPEPYKSIAKQIDSKLEVIDNNIPKPSKRNWLCVNSVVEMYGAIYKTQVELVLSGWNGWDRDIYPRYNVGQ